MQKNVLPVLAIIAVLVAVPAQAAGGIPLPEAPNIMLFALGVAGVIVGRRLAMRGGGKDGGDDGDKGGD